MTVRNLYELYKQGIGSDRRIVFCNYKTQDGFEVRNLADFTALVETFDDRELYILSQTEGKDFIFFEYFEMNESKPGTIAVVRHPHLANAYWKERPDRLVDTFAHDTSIYRFVGIDYGWLLKEFAVELPVNVDDRIWKFLQRRFPKAFYNNVKDTESSYTIVFSNTDRFDNVDPNSVRTFALDMLYPTLKRPTIKSVSQKFWKQLKAFSSEKA